VSITIAGVDRSGGVGQLVCDLLPVLGAVLSPIAKNLVHGVGTAVALAKLLGVRMSV
jgi:hypothetical protein